MENRRNTRRTGAQYEEVAAAFLAERGYCILERNYRNRTGEIDIIARDGSCLVFVEVKYRAGNACGSPLEAVGVRKQRNIIRVAQYYLIRHGYGLETECRFDVVAICGKEISIVKNAFEG